MTKEKEIEEDIEYLDKEFPKGKTKFRGQAMVLLALARKQGQNSQKEKDLEILDNIYFKNPIQFGEEYFKKCKEKGQEGFFYSDFIMAIRDIIVKELKQKIKGEK